MRILIANWSRRKVGGVETHLNSIIPEIASLGHETAFVCEADVPADREPLTLPEGVPSWCVGELGAGRTLSEVRGWRPDLIYVHKLEDPSFEARLQAVAPSVFFAHDYYGTCISGLKTFKRPVPTPCDRRFGPGCLAHYYPRRCGGLSPVTMLRLYRRQARRLELLRRYKAILTHSEHLKAEYIKHGVEPERVFNLSYYAHRWRPGPSPDDGGSLPGEVGGPPPASREPGAGGGPLRLLFLGRMDGLKGGRILLDAVPRARAMLGRPLRLVFAGDGPARRAWEGAARRLQAREGGVEAGLRGVPAAAFAVGGIPTWLSDGVNGFLAPGDPPTPEGLAAAIARCLEDPQTHARLRRGAVEKARQFSLESHLGALMEVFQHVLGGAREHHPA